MIIEGRIAERRQITRGNSDREPRRSHVVDTILGSFTEMPGLCLTVEQAARLFNLKIESCEVILEDLVRESRLHRDARGQYRL
jgi:hypothetical protein